MKKLTRSGVGLCLLVASLALFPDGCDCGSGLSGGGGQGTAGTGGAAGRGGQGGAAAGSGGARLDASADTSVNDAGSSCSFGQASSQATASDLGLFGTPAYFNGGQPLPAGTYVLTYVDGCMKYGSGQGWTVDAYADGSDGWWLIGATTTDKILVLPGTVGYAVGSGAFAAFDDCVAASLLSAPVTFTFGGGVLGVWLQDTPYSDNTAGEDDRNPSWRLDLASCGDGAAPTDGAAD